jgi:hypothetical protein
MKLTSAQVERTLGQFDAKVVPEGHPVMPELTKIFGNHTYFLDESGLLVVEPMEPGDEGSVVKVADWEDASRTVLSCHPPEPTGVVVVLEDNFSGEE